jgi:hypothetical protein
MWSNREYLKTIFPFESGCYFILFNGKGFTDVASNIEKYVEGQTIWVYKSCYFMELIV